MGAPGAVKFNEGPELTCTPGGRVPPISCLPGVTWRVQVYRYLATSLHSPGTNTALQGKVRFDQNSTYLVDEGELESCRVENPFGIHRSGSNLYFK